MESGETSATRLSLLGCSQLMFHWGNILESFSVIPKIPTRDIEGGPTSRLYDGWDINHLQSVLVFQGYLWATMD